MAVMRGRQARKGRASPQKGSKRRPTQEQRSGATHAKLILATIECIREQGYTDRGFLFQLWHILRKERIAEHPQYLGKTLPAHEHSRLRQVGIVIATYHCAGVNATAAIEYGTVDVAVRPYPHIG